MKLPKSVKLGCFEYEVKEDKDENMPEFLGDMNPYIKRIRVRKNMEDQVKRETFLHELLHACCDEARLPPEMEEKFVSVVSPRLFELLQRNPKLINVLLDK